MRCFITILAIFFISSCITKYVPTKTVVKDSLIVETVIKDTIVYAPADSSLVKALIECDSLGRAKIKEIVELKKGKRLSAPTLILADNLLSSSVFIDSIGIYLSLKEKYEKHYSTTLEVQTIEVNILKWWQETLMYIGLATILIIIIKTVLKLK